MSFLGIEVKSFLRFEDSRSETQVHYYCNITKDTMNKCISSDLRLVYYSKSPWTKVRVHGCCGGKRMVGWGDERGC